jgi:hypothetical protein
VLSCCFACNPTPTSRTTSQPRPTTSLCGWCTAGVSSTGAAHTALRSPTPVFLHSSWSYATPKQESHTAQHILLHVPPHSLFLTMVYTRWHMVLSVWCDKHDIHAHTHTHTRTYTRACARAHTHTHTHTRAHAHTRARTHARSAQHIITNSDVVIGANANQGCVQVGASAAILLGYPAPYLFMHSRSSTSSLAAASAISVTTNV